jgi:hypothetical protein
MEEGKGQREEVVSDEPLNWAARIEDGNLIIDPICEEITRENGRQDVIIKVPSLRLINEFKAANNLK